MEIVKPVVLVFYPSNIKNTPLEVPLLKLQERGYRVVMITIQPRGGLHDYYDSIGIEASDLKTWTRRTKAPGPLRYLENAYSLSIAAHKLNPLVIFSHIQEANIPAVVARRLGWLPCPVVTFRHSGNAYHFAEKWMLGQASRKEQLLDQFLNANSLLTTTPGRGVFDMLTKQEGVPIERAQVVPYMYQFDLMSRDVDLATVRDIKAQFPTHLLLVSVMRFVPMKRHYMAIEAVKKLLQMGIDCKLILLDHGPTEAELQAQVEADGLQDKIIFVGRKPSTLPYLAAADLVLHPSITDASNSVVKEAALMLTPSVVVSGIGDFDDYIVHEQNGFIAEHDKWVQVAVQAVQALTSGRLSKQQLGKVARDAVYARFNVSDTVTALYEQLVWVGRQQPK